jgi:hypothetical protein
MQDNYHQTIPNLYVSVHILSTFIICFNLLLNGAHYSQGNENVFDLVEKFSGVMSSWNKLQTG